MKSLLILTLCTLCVLSTAQSSQSVELLKKGGSAIPTGYGFKVSSDGKIVIDTLMLRQGNVLSSNNTKPDTLQLQRYLDLKDYGGEPPSPPAGTVRIYSNGGHYWIKLPNGNTNMIY